MKKWAYFALGAAIFLLATVSPSGNAKAAVVGLDSIFQPPSLGFTPSSDGTLDYVYVWETTPNTVTSNCILGTRLSYNNGVSTIYASVVDSGTLLYYGTNRNFFKYQFSTSTPVTFTTSTPIGFAWEYYTFYEPSYTQVQGWINVGVPNNQMNANYSACSPALAMAPSASTDAIFYGTGGGGGPTYANISFLTPPAISPATSTDFSAWTLTASSLMPTTNYTIQIRYGVDSTVASEGYTDQITFDSGPDTTKTITIPKMGFLVSFAGTDLNYTATATIAQTAYQNFFQNIFATSTSGGFGALPLNAIEATSTVNFVISNPIGIQPASSTVFGGIYTPPAGTSTITATCDPNSGFFADSICNVGIYLFYPTPASINSFADLRGLIAKKPPVGYFVAMANAVQLFNEGTSSVVMMSASTTAAFSTVFSPLRLGFTLILWLIFIIWVVTVRAKHIEL